MSKFEVEVVFKIKADTLEEAKNYVDRIISEAEESVPETNPALNKKWKWWAFRDDLYEIQFQKLLKKSKG